MMSNKKYFIERIDQSKESINKYRNKTYKHNNYKNKIKRPDFIVLDYNICFEVKCYTDKQISLKEHFGLKCFQENTKKNVYLVVYEKQGDDIAKNEKGEAKYFIVKNDDIYDSKNKSCYDENSKLCNLEPEGVVRHTNIENFFETFKIEVQGN